LGLLPAFATHDFVEANVIRPLASSLEEEHGSVHGGQFQNAQVISIAVALSARLLKGPLQTLCALEAKKFHNKQYMLYALKSTLYRLMFS
jgi:hypothetical protein